MKTLIALLVVLSVASCQKVEMRCNYIIETKIQADLEADFLPDENTVAYAFYADTLNYAVASYEQALEGRLSPRSASFSEISFDVKATYDDQTKRVTLADLLQPSVVVVACDTVQKMYAYKQAYLAEGLPQVFAPLTFKPWKFKGENPVMFYTEAKWWIFPAVPPVIPPPPVEPEQPVALLE